MSVYNSRIEQHAFKPISKQGSTALYVPGKVSEAVVFMFLSCVSLLFQLLILSLGCKNHCRSGRNTDGQVMGLCDI